MCSRQGCSIPDAGLNRRAKFILYRFVSYGSVLDMATFKNTRIDSGSDSPGSPVGRDGSVSAFRPATNTSALRALQTIVEPGTQIDHYQVGKLLGRGAMAAVYEGTDIDSGQQVALKILDARVSGNRDIVARFHKEGETMARFDHPNIVRHISHGHDDEFVYMAMELVNGITLDQLIHAIEVEPHHITHLAREISKGLTTIHAAGLVHGDIKPSNIMVTRDGTVKISDFGTAVVSQQSRRGVKNVTGTATYMAPEVLDAGQMVDYRADIFSLGVTFYKVLTKKNPGEPIVPVTELNSELPPAIDGILQKAMAQDPDNRFTTAKELGDAIAALFDENALTTPVSREEMHGPAAETALEKKQGRTPDKIDWKMVILCGLAAIGVAATMIVLAVVFGRW